MIRIGTSGWSYDEWRGGWYPPGLPRAKMLDFYATVFDAVEVNATYYRIPGKASAEGMVRAAAGRLSFAVKAPGGFTHSLAVPEADHAAFLRFLEPFREANRLGSVLMQFPQRFHCTSPCARHLEALAAAMPGIPLVAEFRHGSWDNPKTAGFLDNLDVSRAIVDQPTLRGLSARGAEFRAGRIGYVRFHGRNAAAWHAGDDEGGRYRYRYRREELAEWVPIVRQVERETTTANVFFNNHPESAAPQDAETMAALLRVPLRGTGYRDLFSP